MLISVFLASCDLTGAALGVCGCATEVGDRISFELCGSQTISQPVGGSTGEVPMRLCEYYVNGSIDTPTLGTISSWVPVGSRLCIGDEIPVPVPPRTIEDDIADSFRAFSARPHATWSPGGELEIEVPASFQVSSDSLSVAGSLLGNAAMIRFTPVSASWSFSDGVSQGGFWVERIFLEPGDYTAQASVDYRIDYRYSGGSWVTGAGSGTLQSNRLEISVIKIPRRTLLIGP